MSYLFYKTLVFSITWGNYGSKHKRTLKEEESFEILQIISFINKIQLIKKAGEKLQRIRI